ncbi:MAG: Uma2 family endonuclease [Tildeniella nuda ZEHNDER 1965/U140]|jgi:Uma2 family endonuclease|nr:Uma2 family endonuclease [Tildeniella nuda ZEHNDER 1965/U140]
MVPQLKTADDLQVIYPDSDGKPMADNTKQFRWIVTIQQNVEWLFADDANVFVAGDLLWYPVEGSNKICTAPDVMVIVGRPKGDRGSYQQWREDNIAPQVVFEILSPGNTRTEMDKKLVFYSRYGVEEYYLYDPDRNDLSGWLRNENGLDVIDPIGDWVSPRLGIRFDTAGAVLRLLRPDGEPFTSYTETANQLQQAKERAEQEQQRAEQEQQRAEQEQQRAERLAARLRAAGIDPDEV